MSVYNQLPTVAMVTKKILHQSYMMQNHVYITQDQFL